MLPCPPRMLQSGACGLLGTPWPGHRFAVVPRPLPGLRLSASPRDLQASWAAGLRLGGRSSPGWVLLRTASRTLVVWVWCTLSGFVADGGCCCLALGPVPWLWATACPSQVLVGPALLRRASSGPVARRGAFPHREGTRNRIYLAAARGTWRPAGNRADCACRWPLLRLGRWLAQHGTCPGPHDGVVPGGSLRLQSWAACAAGGWRVWT